MKPSQTTEEPYQWHFEPLKERYKPQEDMENLLTNHYSIHNPLNDH